MAPKTLSFSAAVLRLLVCPFYHCLSKATTRLLLKTPIAGPLSYSIIFCQNLASRSTFVDGAEIKNIENAIRPNTKLIYLESPNTFSYELQDLKAVAQIAKALGILTMIDNSYCGPLYQQPISLGIDLVAQSATKYLGGHSDVVAGVLTGSKEIIAHIFNNEFMNIGPSLSPHSAWLLIRGRCVLCQCASSAVLKPPKLLPRGCSNILQLMRCYGHSV